MIGEKIEDIIRDTTEELLNRGKNVDMPEDLIQTDNIGEVIEKLEFATTLLIRKSLVVFNRILN